MFPSTNWKILALFAIFSFIISNTNASLARRHSMPITPTKVVSHWSVTIFKRMPHLLNHAWLGWPLVGQKSSHLTRHGRHRRHGKPLVWSKSSHSVRPGQHRRHEKHRQAIPFPPEAAEPFLAPFQPFTKRSLHKPHDSP